MKISIRERRDVRKGLEQSPEERWLLANFSIPPGDRQLLEAERRLLAASAAAKERNRKRKRVLAARINGDRILQDSAPVDVLEVTPQLVRWIYAGEYSRLFLRARCQRSSYWAKRRLPWDGVRDKPSIWHEIASFIQKEQLPIISYILGKFTLCSRTPIMPDNLLYEWAAKQCG